MKPVPPHLGQLPSMPPNPMHLVQVVNLVDLVSCTFDGSAVDLGVGVRDGTDLVA